MLQKTDLILLLTTIQEEHPELDVRDYVDMTIRTPGINLEALKFINEIRPLEVRNFYEKLRKSYNDKRSNLYINIMKSDETELKNTMVVLTSLLNQIMIFAEKVEDKQLFLRHSRADELCKVILVYLTKYDIQPAVKLLQLIKADLKTLQEITK